MRGSALVAAISSFGARAETTASDGDCRRLMSQSSACEFKQARVPAAPIKRRFPNAMARQSAAPPPSTCPMRRGEFGDILAKKRTLNEKACNLRDVFGILSADWEFPVGVGVREAPDPFVFLLCWNA